MYQALYRKWRPKTFDQVVGQNHITETLKKQVQTGRLSHAYLFIGTRGTGKTTCAKILARAVNCEAPEGGNPCNRCKACLGIESGSVLDVIELDAASNSGVDNVRALRDEAVFSPVAVKKRVYIIDEVHMLSTSAFNALLKILEEPPGHLMFILATTELHKVPATILSRCQRHSFKRIDRQIINTQLLEIARQENISLDRDASLLLSGLADGSMRDALSLLDQCSGRDMVDTKTVIDAMGLAGHARTTKLLEEILRGDTSKALGVFQSLWEDGKSPAALLNELAGLCRDVLITSISPGGEHPLASGSYEHSTLQKLCDVMSAARAVSVINTIQTFLKEISSGVSPKMAAELCLINLCEPELGDNIQALGLRVGKLEERLSAPALERPALKDEAFSGAPGPTSPAPLRQPEKPGIGPEDAPPWAKEADDGPKDAPPWAEKPDDDTKGARGLPGEPDSEAKESPPPAGLVGPIPHPVTMPAGDEAPQAPDTDLSADGNLPEGADPFQRLSELFLQRLPVGQANLLLDPFHTEISLDGDTLVLRVKNGFAMGQLNKPDCLGLITGAAGEAFGPQIRLRLTDQDVVDETDQNKLDKLKMFGIVKFE